MGYDIHEVCVMLGTTSRTLRYYEEKGLITCEKEPFSMRRRYSEQQIACIRNVLTLRALGLSLKTIAALQRQDMELHEAIVSRRAEIEASIQTKLSDLVRLSDALARLEKADDLDAAPLAVNDKHFAIVRECCEAVLREDTQTLYTHFSEKLKTYLPEDVYHTVWRDTAKPLGRFAAFERMMCDAELANVVYQYLRFEKLGLRIQFVFHGDRIDGLWMTYYEL